MTAGATATATARAPLTKRQRLVMRVIVEYWRAHGAPPTIREIAQALGISSPNGVVCHLRPLHAKGYVVWDSAATREPGDETPSRTRGLVVPELLEAARRAADEYLTRLTKGTDK